MRSIQTRILIMLAALFSVAAIAVLGWTWSITNHEVEEIYDASLVQFARHFSNQLEISHDLDTLDDLIRAMEHSPDMPLHLRNKPSEDNEDDEDYHGRSVHDPGHSYEQHLGLQVWNQQKRLLLSSPHDLDLPIPEAVGFDNLTSNGVQVRSYTLFLPKEKLWVRAVHALSIRTEIASEVAEHILLPLVVVLVVLILAITIAINLNLRPLHQLSTELDQRHSTDLSPIDDTDLPLELLKPIQSLNAMFQRVADTLQRERRFTSDAAHELRTPLAALRIHAECLSLPQESAQPLLQGLNRMERVVIQLLMLARLEPRRSDQLDKQLHDAERLVATLIAELVPTALRSGVQIELHTQPEALIFGEKTLLEILLRNLIENAVRYTHSGDTVLVTLSADQDHCLITVTDHGPGLSDDLKTKVLQRFYRENKGSTEGAGLGFSIVDQIISLHKGSLTLCDTPETGGLTVQVKLPMA
ncbi:ATP-binding protein [Pontibacterium granulatum]|uniref:ATP-binding protein n=1 Tax=Pontibacterium granulatum TaxID=2036029 RepID=UPI00249BC4B3|nr:ATP-binding protein [Pontibacterium granulatum]MDI3323783.1 ATP-binding protein [Pontibacterium granulatum]